MKLVILVLSIVLLSGISVADEIPAIDRIIEAAYAQDSAQRAKISDLTIYAESFARKLKGSGEIKEEKRFLKTYYFRDSLFKPEFLEYFKDGQKQSDKELQKEIKEARKRREKGRSRDASVRPLLPFYPEYRSKYEYKFVGLESKQGYQCHHVRATSLVEDEELLEGDYWFQIDSHNLIYTEFHPARLPGPIKQLDMEMSYKAVDDRYWLMDRFYMYGRGKVAIFIKFYFEVEEIYSGHSINSGLSEELFERGGE